LYNLLLQCQVPLRFDGQAFGIDLVDGAAPIAEALIGAEVEIWFRTKFVGHGNHGATFEHRIRPWIAVELLLFQRHDVALEELVEGRAGQQTRIDRLQRAWFLDAPRHRSAALAGQDRRVRHRLAITTGRRTVSFIPTTKQREYDVSMPSDG